MAVLRDKEEEKGQGTSQALGQPTPGQMQPQEQNAPQQAQPSAPATIGGSSEAQPSAPVKAMPKQQKAGTGTFSNLKTYLQAAQGGGQQKVAQAATQQVQRLGASAQKGVQQAQESFGRQMQAGSLSGMETAGQEAADIVKAARSVTYQAPQAPAQSQAQTEQETTSQSQPQPQAPAQSQQYFTPEQQQRFAEIINAQYQGPASLQQAGLYEQAARKARTAQQAGELTQTAGGREQLLRDVFGRGRDYSRGAARLDALLLNASEQGVQQLQQQAQPALQSQQALQAAQNLSTNEAAQRAAAIEGIRSGARQQFTEARAAEEKAVEDRIKNLIETPVTDAEGKMLTKADGTPMTEWDRLPEFFRQSLTAKAGPQWQLSAEEAAILGVGAGEGLYNIRPEDIRTTQAERERLITKNELSRQLALARLAGTDISRELQKDLQFTDLEKAGTQNLASSLDTESFRRLLNESQQNFKEAAEAANLTGTGKKKVSRGNLAGKKTSTYNASVGGNVADMLRQAGYDVAAENEATKSLLSDKDLLDKYLGATSTSRDVEANIGGSGLESGAKGAAIGASIGSLVPGVGTAIGAGVGALTGGIVGTNTFDATQMQSDLAKELEEKLGIKGLGAVGQGIQDARGMAGDIYGETYGKALDAIGLGSISSGIKGAISGIDTGAMKAYGSAIAKDLAIKDLQNKYAQWLKGQGFENRANIADTEATRARTAALQQLLRRQG